MAVKAVFFDKDGTFVDFAATWGPALEATMRQMANGDAAAFARLCTVNAYDPATGIIGPTSPFIAEASADFSQRWASALGTDRTPAFLARMDDLLDQSALASLAPIGDPVTVFSTLKKNGYALGIITNDNERGARLQAEALGILDYCDVILGYDSGHGRKPAPDPVLGAAAMLGLAPHQVAMVGDTLHDLNAGRAAGALTIAVTSGFAGADVLRPHADHVLADISGVPALLQSVRNANAATGPQP